MSAKVTHRDPSLAVLQVTPETVDRAGRPHHYCRYCRADFATYASWARHTRTVHNLRPVVEDESPDVLLELARAHEREARSLRKDGAEAEGTIEETVEPEPELKHPPVEEDQTAPVDQVETPAPEAAPPVEEKPGKPKREQ